MGYEPFVRDALAGQAEVWGPPTNGSHTVNVLINLHAWVLNRHADVVHINAGLHDLKTVVYDGRANVVPVEHYARNVEVMLQTIRRHVPAAKLIWALTTPVHDDRAHAAHANAKDFDRFDSDVRRYNDAARTICEPLDIRINDLYSVVCSAGLERVLRDDGVHYTQDGYQLLAKKVSQAVREAW